MSDIELVIKIPEELKNKIDNANEDNYRTYIWWFDTTLYCAIKNGTSLPKGHGDLIDANELLKMTNSYKSELGRLKADPFVKSGIETVENFIRNLPTIIEADKEE